MRSLIGLAVVLVASLSIHAADHLPDARAKAVDAAVREEMAKLNIVGLAIGVVQDGKIVYLKGYGYADRESKSPVTNQTMFRWASCSKPVCAVAALQLVEQKKLNLDDDVRKHVPEFPDRGETITVRHLLCHQGGIVHYTNGKVVRTRANYAVEHPFADVVTALDTFKDSPLVCKPGEKYSYTTHGYMLLSAVVQRAGRKPFAEQVSERILRPLGMTSMQPDYQWKAIPNRAVGYKKDKESIVRSTDTDVSWKLGGGGYISNIEDFARFAQGLVNHSLVKPATETMMWQRQKTVDGKLTGYGLGFTVAELPGGVQRIGHGGSQEKTRTDMRCYPAQKRAVVVMTNCEWVKPADVAAIIEKAMTTP